MSKLQRMLTTTSQYPYPITSALTNCLNSLVHTPTQPTNRFMPKGPISLATDLMQSYFDRGLIREARKLFDEMPERDVVAWTAMIAGYSSCNEYTRAWNVFRDMLSHKMSPNAFTVSSVLKACKGMNSLCCGTLVHGLTVKSGIDGLIYVDNALVDMYASCCVGMREASLVFQGIRDKNSVSWTILIAGYVHRAHAHRALQIFKEMLLEEAELNPHIFSIVVRACASIGSEDCGIQLHSTIVKIGFEINLPVMNSLLDMYCRCSCLSEGNRIFGEMSEKDLISWNTLIAGYQRLGSIQSLYTFSKMESQGFQPNSFTYSSVIAACATLAVLHFGQQVHGRIVRFGLNENMTLANALIDMYAKCGNIADSDKIFRHMSSRSLVSWTSMMIGYGAHGYGKEAVKLFDQMVASGVTPDQIAFTALLSACSHAGLVDQGLSYFHVMKKRYCVKPNQAIYGCIVDLLGRAGRMEEAYQLIKSMPFKPDESVWSALLGACKAHRLSELGKLAAQRVLDLRPNFVGAYLIMSNFYAAEGKWVEAAKMRKLIKGLGSRKETGTSWIEVRNQVWSFVVGDKTGSHMVLVYESLHLLTLHITEADYATYIDRLINNNQEHRYHQG